MRILFITAHRLGDAVLSTATLSALMTRYPEARFTIACGPDVVGLFEHMPRCERIIPLFKHRYNRHWLTLWWASVQQKWFMVVDLRSSLVSLGLRAQKRLIVHGGRRARHKLAQHQRMLKMEEGFAPTFWSSPDDRFYARKLLAPSRRHVALALTAGSEVKIWPPERFVALAQRFVQAGFVPVLFYGVGPREQSLAEPVCRQMPEGTLVCGGERSLGRVAALLRECVLFVGNDSGLMHLAAAVGVPTLGLFGPSRASEYGPAGPRTKVLYAPGPDGKEEDGRGIMARLDDERVFKEACRLYDGV